MSKTLNFILPFDHKEFEIEYESDSKERNLLMKVRFNGFLLDISELMVEYKELYNFIRAAMKSNAENYWSDAVQNVIDAVVTGNQDDLFEAMGKLCQPYNNALRQTLNFDI